MAVRRARKKNEGGLGRKSKLFCVYYPYKSSNFHYLSIFLSSIMDVNRDEYLQECFRVDRECWPTGTRCCDDHEKLNNNSNIATTRDSRSKHWATRPSQGHATITRRIAW